MSSLCIKTNNEEVLSYLQNEFSSFNMLNTFYSRKEFKHYKNIIIEKVENYDLDSYGRQDLETVGDGEGYYITNGYALPITWQKANRDSKTIYKYLDDSKVVVNDGNTFIQIIPITTTPEFN